MKKVFAIVLMVCLVAGMVFAASDIKVGASVGYDAKTSTMKMTDRDGDSSKGSYKFGGFNFDVFGEYEIEDNISAYAKASFAFGKLSYTNGYSSKTFDGSFDNISVGIGAKYDYEVNKDITAYGAALVNVYFDNLYNDSKTNVGIGITAEAGAQYRIDKQISVIGGASFGWVFYDENRKDLVDAINEYSGNASYFISDIKVFAGASYAL